MMLRLFLFLYFVRNLVFKPLFREFVVVELLNVHHEALESRTIHCIYDGLVPSLLILAYVGNFSRFRQFFEASEDRVVKMLEDGLPLHERNQADLGSPALDEVSKEDLPVDFVLVGLVDQGDRGRLHNLQSFVPFVLIDHLLIEVHDELAGAAFGAVDRAHAVDEEF